MYGSIILWNMNYVLDLSSTVCYKRQELVTLWELMYSCLFWWVLLFFVDVHSWLPHSITYL